MGQSTSEAEAVAAGWQITGGTGAWRLLCKATNPATGEYHSTKVLELRDGSCIIQSDTRTPEGGFVRSMVHAPALPLAELVG